MKYHFYKLKDYLNVLVVLSYLGAKLSEKKYQNFKIFTQPANTNNDDLMKCTYHKENASALPPETIHFQPYSKEFFFFCKTNVILRQLKSLLKGGYLIPNNFFIKCL